MDEKYRIHAAYILSILVSLIVILVTVEWTNIPDLVDYVAFALTLSSLILAILAIVYSMVSNNSLGKVLQNLNISSGNLKDTSKQIDESNRVLLEELKQIPNAIAAVDREVQTTQSMIREAALEGIGKESHVEVPEEGALSENLITSYVERSSIRGLEALLCIVLSRKTKTAFDYSEVCKKAEGGLKESEDYLFAYYVSARSMGLLGTEIDAKGRIVVMFVHDILVNNVERVLIEKLQEVAVEMVEESEQEDYEADIDSEMSYWFASINRIKEYFGENPIEYAEQG